MTERCLLETEVTTFKKKKKNQSAAKDRGARRKNKISHRYVQLSEPQQCYKSVISIHLTERTQTETHSKTPHIGTLIALAYTTCDTGLWEGKERGRGWLGGGEGVLTHLFSMTKIPVLDMDKKPQTGEMKPLSNPRVVLEAVPKTLSLVKPWKSFSSLSRPRKSSWALLANRPGRRGITHPPNQLRGLTGQAWPVSNRKEIGSLGLGGRSQGRWENYRGCVSTGCSLGLSQEQTGKQDPTQKETWVANAVNPRLKVNPCLSRALLCIVWALREVFVGLTSRSGYKAVETLDVALCLLPRSLLLLRSSFYDK